jgi:hypothetical protein
MISCNYAEEVYYTGKKYIELSENVPLNIPVINKTLAPLEPTNYSAFKGVVDTLGDYLKTSVRLPYAWVEYLRWRFGTTFHSDNTGKPGIILYDYGSLGTSNPLEWEAKIAQIRAEIASCGRAIADLKVAYDDHQLRWDVEKAHYDEKEFNLRVNMGYDVNPEKGDGQNYRLYLDSRLDMNAAIQAVTISTSTEFAPIVVSRPILHVYLTKQIQMLNMVDWVNTPHTIQAGWYSVPYLRDVEFDNFYINFRQLGSDNPTAGIYAGTENTADVPLVIDSREIGAAIGLKKSPTESELAASAFKLVCAILAGDALQLHKVGLTYEIGEKKFTTTMLSYDMAIVSLTQIENIQRTAMRNLTRGSYKAKTPTTQKTEVKEAVSQIETAAVSEIKKDLK